MLGSFKDINRGCKCEAGKRLLMHMLSSTCSFFSSKEGSSGVVAIVAVVVDELFKCIRQKMEPSNKNKKKKMSLVG